MRRGTVAVRRHATALVFVLAISGSTIPARAACPGAQEHALPLPSSLPKSELVAFERQLFDFLDKDTYDRDLHWCRDKGVRDTGPFRNGVYYGTHPAVRIFYSPKMMSWLEGGRVGVVPDGAMMIKEQYRPPAARYAGLSPDQVTARFAEDGKDWTVMIHDSSLSKDGWFWMELYTGMSFDTFDPPFPVAQGGAGLYCLRCHGAAETEQTFAALENIEGYPGTPITYDVDDSWKSLRLASSHAKGTLAATADAGAVRETTTNPLFLTFFRGFRPVKDEEVQRFPGENHDHVVAPPGSQGSFVTSDQCMGCHGGLNGPFGPTMFHVTAPPIGRAQQGVNYSPFGEWRWSPMGLGGRDPIFFAQVESEVAALRKNPDPVAAEAAVTGLQNACFRCHGMMAKHQLEADEGTAADFDPHVYFNTDPDDPKYRYGGLAREGVSCESCHRIVSDTRPLVDFLGTNTGFMEIGEPGKVFGPFKDAEIAPKIMRNGIGVEPVFGDQMKSSRACGSCHTIVLPVLDSPVSGTLSVEQATFTEWINSQYENEIHPDNPNARTCQDCHMRTDYRLASKGVDVPELKSKIAIVQDETYPRSAHEVPVEDSTVRTRESGFARHTFHGLNAFLLTIFQQFNEVLGLRIPDYMSGSTSGLDDSIANMVQQARTASANVTMSPLTIADGTLSVDVKVENLAGHRFPSGVGFRRAFLELVVTQRKRGGDDVVVFASGRTNDIGVIVDLKGRPLPTEFFEDQLDAIGETYQAYQPHHQTITRSDQVQIYEELVRDANGRFTTSFVRRDEVVKDNRLLPKGWKREGPGPELPDEYLHATLPEGDAEHDPDFTDGTGSDTVTYQIALPKRVDPAQLIVTATLWSQSIQPSFLDARFKGADGPATKPRIPHVAPGDAGHGRRGLEAEDRRRAAARMSSSKRQEPAR
jgi:hypothetical protein